MLPRLLGLSSLPALRTALTHPKHNSLATRLVIQNPSWSRSISITRPVLAARATKAEKSTKEKDAEVTKKSRPRVRKSVGYGTKAKTAKVAKKGVAAKKPRKEAKVKINFPKVPANPFAIFVKEIFTTKEGSVEHGQVTSVMREAAEKWRNLSESEKQPYKDKFQAAHGEYKVVLEEFYKGLDKATLRKFNKQREAKGLIKKRQPKETRAPPNSYSMFLTEYYRTRVTDVNQNHNFAEGSREAGKAWKALTDAERQEWHNKAKQARAEWEKTHGKDSE